MAEQKSSIDPDDFDNAPGAPNLAGAGDNIDFEESLPANDKETSSIITNSDRDEATEDAQEDVV